MRLFLAFQMKCFIMVWMIALGISSVILFGCGQSEDHQTDSTTAAILRNLRVPNEHARLLAVKKLSQSTIPERKSLLIEALRDSSAGVQLEAATALLPCSDMSVAIPFLDLLSVSDTRVQLLAAKSLLLMHDESLNRELLLRLSSQFSVQTRSWCVALLGEKGVSSAIPEIAPLLQSNDERLAIAAVISLGKFGTETLDRIKSVFRQLPVRVKSYAATTIAEHDPEAITWFEANLVNADTQTQIACIEGLSALDTPQSSKIISQYFTHEDPLVRRAALIAASQLSDPAVLTAREAIIRDDPDPMIRLLGRMPVSEIERTSSEAEMLESAKKAINEELERTRE